jgi:hypothetical protein
MIYVCLVVLLIIVVVFGISSGMQSYAAAQQAEAVIQVAKVAQVNAWSNVVLVLALLALVVLILAFLAAIVWFSYQRRGHKTSTSASLPRVETAEPPALPSGRALELLLMAKILERLDGPASPAKNLLEAPREESLDDPFPWLR